MRTVSGWRLTVCTVALSVVGVAAMFAGGVRPPPRTPFAGVPGWLAWVHAGATLAAYTGVLVALPGARWRVLWAFAGVPALLVFSAALYLVYWLATVGSWNYSGP